MDLRKAERPAKFGAVREQRKLGREEPGIALGKRYQPEHVVICFARSK